MKFNGITKKGREYLAKIQAENKPINFVKIKIGDGRLDNYDNPAELEHLINQKVEKGILTLNQEHDTVILTTNIDNVTLRTGYYPREIGVFVNDNGQEIMYYYMNDGDETSWIPPETDGPFKIELKLNLIASNAQSIVVEGVGKDLYITKEFLEANYTQKGGYTGTAQEIDDRVVSALGKEDGKFPLTEAVKGNVYYFPGNKKFYICKEAQNRRVSVPDGNFEELSIWENRKRLENLTRKTILLFYNGGSLIPNGTTSIPVNENWYFFGIGVGTAVQSGKERMCFLFRTIFQSNNDILRFNGIEIKYNATDKTLKVINNGGNLYFLEQYSSLI
nr:MAG TPA: tail-collar fiber protein [Caudoviricetes sp.]